ncbi:DUF2345 domain-containing protein, partial [Rahnella sp. CG8]
VSLTAVDGDILFSAKKRITLIGGGSYLILQDGKIEYGTAGEYFRKTPHTVLTVAETMPHDFPSVPPVISGLTEQEAENEPANDITRAGIS